MITRKTWTDLEDQLIIDVFNKCGQDSLAASRIYRKLNRTQIAVAKRLSILRKQGLINDSEHTDRAKRIAETRYARATEMLKESVKQESKSDLMGIAALIISKLSKEEKQQLVMELIA